MSQQLFPSRSLPENAKDLVVITWESNEEGGNAKKVMGHVGAPVNLESLEVRLYANIFTIPND